MARAVGTQRRQVVQMFVTEGMVYALAAAAIGVLAGIGVTFAMTSFIGQMFNNLTGQVNSQAAGLFGVTFNIRWQSVVISYCLGAILTFVVIAAASWRVSRMNIVTPSAIRRIRAWRRTRYTASGWLCAGGGWRRGAACAAPRAAAGDSAARQSAATGLVLLVAGRGQRPCRLDGRLIIRIGCRWRCGRCRGKIGWRSPRDLLTIRRCNCPPFSCLAAR